MAACTLLPQRGSRLLLRISKSPPFCSFFSAVSVVLLSLQPEVELQEDSPEIYRLAPNLESPVANNSRLLSRLLSPGMDPALLRLRG